MALWGNIVIRDVIANLPAASVAGTLFIGSDTGQVLRDNGSSWDLITSGLLGEVFIPPALLYPSTTSGSAPIAQTEYTTNDVDMKSLAFDASSQEYAQCTWWTPLDWDADTITAQLMWTAASGVGTVIWGVQGRCFADDDALDQAWGTAQEVTDILITAADLHVTDVTAAITLAGTPAAGQIAQLRVYRKAASDTLAVDAKLMGLRLAYTKAALS